MNLIKSKTVFSAAMLQHVLLFTIIYMLMASVLFGNVALGKKDNKVSPQNRDKRNAVTSQVPQNDQLMNILQEYDTNSVDVNLLRYTPTTPSPEDVNCYVEVPVTRRVGGRCVLLGSSTWGCQAGIFLAFSSECQSEATHQPGTQTGSDDPAQGVTQGTSRNRNPFRRRRRPNRR